MIFNINYSMRYFAMICLGILSIHKNQYVHREISSKHIFIKKYESNREFLIIGHFATAKREVDIDELDNLFSAYYGAPEQIRNKGGSQKSDCWAAGIILYEMLAGSLPF